MSKYIVTRDNSESLEHAESSTQQDTGTKDTNPVEVGTKEKEHAIQAAKANNDYVNSKKQAAKTTKSASNALKKKVSEFLKKIFR